MFLKIRARFGVALAAVLLLSALSIQPLRAAEFDDFTGTWDAGFDINVEIDGSAEPISTLAGTLVLEPSGVTMGGSLVIQTPEGEARIPIQGATIEGDRLNLEVTFSNTGGDSAFELLMGPLFGDLGVEGEAGIRFVGWLESTDFSLTGRIDAEGFEIPGIMEALFLGVSGTKIAGPGIDPLPEDEFMETEDPELSEAEDETADEDGLHAGADAEVEALEASDLADQEAAVQLSAARVIAEQERKRKERADALRKLQRVHTYRYQMVGDTVEGVVADASVRALVTTASRLYYGNYVILGRDLLEPYLRQNGSNFVVHAKVLGERGVDGGGRRVDIEVAIDTDRLYEDLDSKHFIAEPNFRPVMVVSLDESLNDQQNRVSLARATLEELIKQVDLRVEEDQILGDGLATVDATTDPATLRLAREEAQRLGADVLVTGTTRLYGPESRIILFDQFYEVSGELSLQFIRADNGEVLRTYRGTYTATAPNAEEAIEDCFFELGSNAITSMAQGFLEEWQNTMLDRTEYRICITGADEKILEVFESELQSLSPEVQVFRKSHYADVAVLNLKAPGAERQQIEEFLRRRRVPEFKVIPTLSGHYELRVL